MSRGCLLAVLLTAGCGGSPTAPSAPVVTTPPAETWIISGQSNAVGCAIGSGPAPVEHVQAWGASLMPAADPLPFMDPYPGCQVGPWVWAAQAVNRSVRLTGWAQAGNPIKLWEAGGPGWQHLAEAIHQHGQNARYFLWWQGEADAVAETPHYGEALRDLVRRVRAEARAPALHLVVIGLADPPRAELEPAYAMIRAEQHTAAQAEGGTVVPATGLPINGYHLTADGYRQLGARLAAALP